MMKRFVVTLTYEVFPVVPGRREVNVLARAWRGTRRSGHQFSLLDDVGLEVVARIRAATPAEAVDRIDEQVRRAWVLVGSGGIRLVTARAGGDLVPVGALRPRRSRVARELRYYGPGERPRPGDDLGWDGPDAGWGWDDGWTTGAAPPGCASRAVRSRRLRRWPRRSTSRP